LGRVDCIDIEGLRLWFNSNDHLPPHFHVTKTGEWELRVYFLHCTQSHLDFDKKWGREPSRKILEQLLRSVLQNHAGLLEEWELKVSK
jgi:hypothetical protein